MLEKIIYFIIIISAIFYIIIILCKKVKNGKCSCDCSGCGTNSCCDKSQKNHDVKNLKSEEKDDNS